MNPSNHNVTVSIGNYKTTRNFNVILNTFPLVPAYSLTVEKVQGVTLDHMILTSLHHPSRPSFSGALLYVALSRVRRLSSLYLTEKLTRSDLHTPSPELVTLMAKLEAIGLPFV
jgi:ATP-dependent exoDNAse (exonuclease V) alpha subunit